MPHPTQRRTSSTKRKRASHFALKSLTRKTCPKCKKPVLPHNVCKSCGTYRGKVILKNTRAERRAKKAAARARSEGKEKKE